MDESNPRKRPRPVVSCFRCRDKKLKCDRTSPCENCIKAQIPDSCKYQPGVNGSSKEPSSGPPANATVIDDLQARLAKVEELLGIRSSEQPISGTDAATPQAIGTVVVKGGRSIFRGQNDRTTLLNQFLEVKEFINEMSRDKHVQASAKQIKFLQKKSMSKIGSPDTAGVDYSMALLKLREHLPPKPYCDRLLAIYCQQFERTFRVLHIPTFVRRYNRIWTHEQPDIFTSSSIIPELTAVMTMAYHMDDSQQSVEDRNYRTYLKEMAIDNIQDWLDELGRKQRTEISTLQVEVLLLLSRSLRGIQPEQLWSSTGALVRSAMVMGLNVDPATVAGITPYMAEMRRRLWATILEVDLQASMFCGMPLVIPELNSSSLVPSNINDQDLEETSLTLPDPYPIETYTDSIYQVVLASSLPQRMKALSVLQHHTPDIQEGLRLGRQAEKCLLRKPSTLQLPTVETCNIDGGSLSHRVLLDVYMRRPLIRLYMALIHGNSMPSASTKSLLAELEQHCLRSSQVILSYQELFTDPRLQKTAPNFWAQQNWFYNACKMDVLWAALTLCQTIKQNVRSDNPSDNLALIHPVQTTIDHLINRIGRKGSDLKDVVFLALVLQSVQIPNSAPSRSQALQHTAKSTLAACRERLLQPIVSNESPSTMPQVQPAHTTQATHRMSMSVETASLPVSVSNMVSPSLSDNRSTPTFMSDSNFPHNLPAGTEQYFGDLGDLATEYNSFQTGIPDPNDPLNFGITQSWNWEHMWQ
ncbi:hypothetical protein E8E13_001577 [Curvularia kusanoi]|uniref:Zn(2)-C6 fungal-type domain-containing protein n=1 Tax=Curvularia kusanoi TaxID=90978 RepID=A0A9P4T4Y8_CURKU|nr:hypothetical protein E8E13_001577 [Curvularia kusanoi]